MATIKFKISKTGEVKVEVDGVVGSSCQDISKVFTDAIGTTVAVEEKPECYDQIDQMETSIYESEE